MRVIVFVGCAAVGAAIAAPVSADVTVRSRVVVQQGNDRRTFAVTEYRKGLKTRTDSSAPGVINSSMVMDAGTGRIVMLWHDSKTATEEESYGAPQGPAPGNGSAAAPSITPTSRTREIAGSTCAIYQVSASIPSGGVDASGPANTFMEGTICLVKDGPGQAEFLRLQRTVAERRGSSDPMTILSLATADLGVPLASELTVSIGATAPNAERRQVSHHTMEVTSISTESIPDSMFEIPPGYTVTK